MIYKKQGDTTTLLANVSVTRDWSEEDENSLAYIQNKPNAVRVIKCTPNEIKYHSMTQEHENDILYTANTYVAPVQQHIRTGQWWPAGSVFNEPNEFQLENHLDISAVISGISSGEKGNLIEDSCGPGLVETGYFDFEEIEVNKNEKQITYILKPGMNNLAYIIFLSPSSFGNVTIKLTDGSPVNVMFEKHKNINMFGEDYYLYINKTSNNTTGAATYVYTYN